MAGSGGKEGSRDLAEAQRVVEDVHPAAAGHLQQQLLNQRVVSRMHLQPAMCVAASNRNRKSSPMNLVDKGLREAACNSSYDQASVSRLNYRIL